MVMCVYGDETRLKCEMVQAIRKDKSLPWLGSGYNGVGRARRLVQFGASVHSTPFLKDVYFPCIKTACCTVYVLSFRTLDGLLLNDSSREWVPGELYSFICME